MIELEQVFWVVANKWESHSETCMRKSFAPMDVTGSTTWAWNFTVLSYVVTTLLKLKILPTTNNTGISSCCAPSLWCDQGGCFTQGYSRYYTNYGWLSQKNGHLNTPNPVYTCYNYSRLQEIEFFNASLSNGLFAAKGHFAPYPNASLASPSELSVNIFGAECRDVEVTYCRHCDNKQFTCPFGSTCLSSPASSASKSCYLNCDSPTDKSCPRGYFCHSYSQGPYNCFPKTNLDVNSFCSGRNYLSNDDFLTCKVNSAQLQQQYPLSLQPDKAAVLNISLSLDPGSSVARRFPYHASPQRCKANLDCFDGNICTRDSCIASSGYCFSELTNASASCDSISKSVRDRVAPFVYHLHYALSNSTMHRRFRDFMLHRGKKKSIVTSRDDWPFQTELLNFNITFFGNKISEICIGPNGLIMLPPLPRNSLWRNQTFLDQFRFFTSASNVIAPWYADWNPLGTDSTSQVLVYHQSRGDASGLFSADANAVHVFYSNIRRFSTAIGNSSHSFAASIYSDSSVRFSYLNATNKNGFQYSDFSGLWGAFVSQKLPSFSRYHFENISKPLIFAQQDAIFCYFQTVACVENACIRSGSTLMVRWDGSDRCDALAVTESPIRIVCAWAGGLAVTPASLSGSGKYLQCAVPALPFPDGFITSVDIVIGLNKELMASKGIHVQEDGENYSGAKSVFGVSFGHYSELSRSNLMVEYFSNHSSAFPSQSCGCNPISRKAHTDQCDVQNVCRGDGDGDAFYVDCFGTAFGSAYVDPCGTCAMGKTGRYPSSSCQSIPVIISIPPEGNGFLGLLSQTIILLVIICCLTFITSAVSYTVRRLLRNRELEEQLQVGEADLALTLELNEWNTNYGGGRGLSEFERDALGQVTFTPALYKEIISHMGGSKRPADPAPSEASGAEVSEKEDNSAVELGESSSPSSPTCECSICLMELQEGNICRALPEPCGHIFHLACIDEWFRQSLVCPLCKRSIRAILEGVEEHSSSSAATANRNSSASSSTRSLNRSNNTQPAFLPLPTMQQSLFMPLGASSLPPPRIVVPSSRSASRNSLSNLPSPYFGHAVAPAVLQTINAADSQPVAQTAPHRSLVPTGGGLFPPASRAGFERALTSEEQAQWAEEGAGGCSDGDGDDDDEEQQLERAGRETATEGPRVYFIPDDDESGGKEI